MECVKFFGVLKAYEYLDGTCLIAALPKVIAPAKEMAEVFKSLV